MLNFHYCKRVVIILKFCVYLRWTFNPAVLTKVSGPVGLSDAGNNLSPNGVGGLDNGHHFSVGDLVQICSDMERMKVSGQIILRSSFGKTFHLK